MPPDYNYSQKDLSDFLLTKVFFIGISLMIKHFAIDWNSSFLKEKIIWFNVYKAFFVNLFQANVPFLRTSRSPLAISLINAVLPLLNSADVEPQPLQAFINSISLTITRFSLSAIFLILIKFWIWYFLLAFMKTLPMSLFQKYKSSINKLFVAYLTSELCKIQSIKISVFQPTQLVRK